MMFSGKRIQRKKRSWERSLRMPLVKWQARKKHVKKLQKRSGGETGCKARQHRESSGATCPWEVKQATWEIDCWAWLAAKKGNAPWPWGGHWPNFKDESEYWESREENLSSPCLWEEQELLWMWVAGREGPGRMGHRDRQPKAKCWLSGHPQALKEA